MKSQKIELSQEVKPQAPSVDASVGGVFDALLSAGQGGDFGVIPAEHVGLHVLDLPIRSARQRRDAVPFALEETLGQSLDKVHFALCETFADGRLLVAVVDKDQLDRQIEASPETPIVAEQMLLAPPASGPSGEITWRTYGDGVRILVRASDGTGFAAQADMFALLWRAAGTPGIDPHGVSPAVEADILTPSTGPLAAVETVMRYDLRQGPYQPSRGLARPVRWLAAGLVVAAFGHMGVTAADIRAQRAIADTLQEAAGVALESRLPGASADAPPARLVRQIALVSRAQSGSNFLPLMNDVSQAWLRDGVRAQLRQLSWSDGALRLVVETSDLEALQRAEASLTASGLRVSSGSATADGGSARADLLVRP